MGILSGADRLSMPFLVFVQPIKNFDVRVIYLAFYPANIAEVPVMFRAGVICICMIDISIDPPFDQYT